MKASHKIISLITLALFIYGCAGMTVRQEDLDSWVGVSVEELDTHSFFLTVPVAKTITDSGIEIRVYSNKQNISSCFDTGNIDGKAYSNDANFTAIQNCSSQLVGCDNIFYIKDKKVIEYKPVGRCMTDATLQPERKNF
jgi:hypothetical protein|tara:strand:+ start:111 stop:527 length:417 start_codon:yes stop_codon:yes gene_type:complete